MAAKKGKKKKSGIRKVTVSRTRHHHHAPKKRRKSRAVGSTTLHRPKRRKKKGFLGATGHSNTLKSIGLMAIGVGTGAAITHIILRPIEGKLVEKWPMIGKVMATGEIFLGGLIALKGKNAFQKSLGLGILAGGTHGLMKQLNVYKHIPGIHGPGDFTEVHVPISGSFDNMLAGILDDSRRRVHTETVAGTNHTAIVADTDYMGDSWEDAYSSPVKG